MRTVILFIAMSLDGYLADRRGGVGWLRGQDPCAEDPDSYAPFSQRVDTVLMGWNTYHQIITELSPEHWVYDGMTSYVFTHRELPSTDAVRFTSQDPCALVRALREQPGRDIWACGGADLIGQLMAGDCIDRLEVSVIPVCLGGGIPLFRPTGRELPLRLLETRQDNGIVELIYQRRR